MTVERQLRRDAGRVSVMRKSSAGCTATDPDWFQTNAMLPMLLKQSQCHCDCGMAYQRKAYAVPGRANLALKLSSSGWNKMQTQRTYVQRSRTSLTPATVAIAT